MHILRRHTIPLLVENEKKKLSGNNEENAKYLRKIVVQSDRAICNKGEKSCACPKTGCERSCCEFSCVFRGISPSLGRAFNHCKAKKVKVQEKEGTYITNSDPDYYMLKVNPLHCLMEHLYFSN